MIGRKIYYELATGDVVLITPEKHNENAVNTTKEQDFELYGALQIRNPETVGVIQLEYGQHRGDFELANSVKVDLETGNLLFSYPVFEPPLTAEVQNLRAENTALRAENEALLQKAAENERAILELSMLMGGTV